MSLEEKSAGRPGPIEELKENGENAIRDAADRPEITLLSRLGHAAIGILYLTIGILAVQVALGARNAELTDQIGALEVIARQPYGEVLLLTIAVGLVGYAVWGFLRAIIDPLKKGKDFKGLLSRSGYVISAVTHGALLAPTLGFLFSPYGFGSRDSEEQAEALSASILSRPGGSLVVGAFGIGFAIFGVAQIVRAFRSDFNERFETHHLDENRARWIIRLGRFGTIGRGVVFVVIGILVTYAAVRLDPEAIGGMDAALLVLAQQTYGALILALVALGLISFGLYFFLAAVIFRIRLT